MIMSAHKVRTQTAPDVRSEETAVWIPEWSAQERPGKSSRYAVIVHDDDVHACRDFVELLEVVFDHEQGEAYSLTQEIASAGRAAVWKGSRDAAERKAQRARDFQPQWRRSDSVTAPHRVAEIVPPLTITVELAEEEPEFTERGYRDGQQHA